MNRPLASNPMRAPGACVQSRTRARGVPLRGIKDYGANAGQQMHMLVAIHMLRRSPECGVEGRELGLHLRRHRLRPQPAGKGPGQS